MAPYNLSDFAVKEIKISGSELAPATTENYLGKFLLAHLIDLWSIFCITLTAKIFFQATVSALIMTPKLHNAWDLVDFSVMTFTTMLPVGLAYFFTSYFMNHGQTYGMKLTKTRIVMREHSFTDAFQWALKSFAIFATFGYKAKSYIESVSAQDHLWRVLITQKETSAPDVRTLITEATVTEMDYKEAA